MNSKSGAIPKESNSNGRRARILSSDSDGDIEYNFPYGDRTHSRMISNRPRNFPILPTLQDISVIEIDDDVISLHDLAFSSTPNLTKDKDKSEESFSIDEINEMISKYENEQSTKEEILTSAVEIVKGASCLALQNNTKSSKLKENVIDLRHKQFEHEAQRKYSGSIAKMETIPIITTIKKPIKNVSQSKNPIIASNAQREIDLGNLAKMHAVSTAQKPFIKMDSLNTLPHSAKNPAISSIVRQEIDLGIPTRMQTSTTQKPLIKINSLNTLAHSAKNLTIPSIVRQKIDLGVSTRRQTASTTQKPLIKMNSLNAVPHSVKYPLRPLSNRIINQTGNKRIIKSANCTVAKKFKTAVTSTINKRANRKTSVGTGITVSGPSTKNTLVKKVVPIPESVKISVTTSTEIVIGTPSPVDLQTVAPTVVIPSYEKEKCDASPSRGVILECPVCFEQLLVGRPTVITACGHMFCRSCMNDVQSKGTNVNCPLCRVELTGVINIHV